VAVNAEPLLLPPARVQGGEDQHFILGGSGQGQGFVVITSS
jgi:hypothetical protein